MANKNSIQIVETLLATYDLNKFSSSAEQLAYERGVLTAILADLVYSDTYVAAAIKAAIQKRLNQK